MNFSYFNSSSLNKWLGGQSATLIAIDPAFLSTECGKCSMLTLLEASFPNHLQDIYFVADDDDAVAFKNPADVTAFQNLTPGLSIRENSHFFGRPFRPAKRMKRVGYPGGALFDTADVLSNNDIRHLSSFSVSERGYEIFVFLESCGHKGVYYDYVEEVFIFKDDTDAGLFQAYIATLADVPKNQRGSYKRPKNMAELEEERQEKLRKELEAAKRAEEEYKRQQREHNGYYDLIKRINRSRRTGKNGKYEFALDEKQIEELLEYVEEHHRNRTTVGNWADRYYDYTNDPLVYDHKPHKFYEEE